MKRVLFSGSTAGLLFLSVCALLLALWGSRRMDRGSYHGVVISEICTHNETILYDENGNYGTPYLELYNTGDEPVNLAGCGLSDNKEEPYQCAFPDFILGAKETLLLWGGRSGIVWTHYKSDFLSMYLDFMPADGGYCILTDPDGNRIQRITIPKLSEGVSFQITQEEPDGFRIGKPSPGEVFTAAEISMAANAGKTVEQPVMSASAGFYDEPFFLTLKADRSDRRIYYTTDGSQPDEQAILYTEPIYIEDRSSADNLYAGIGGITIKEREQDGALFPDYIPETPVDKATVVKAVAVDAHGNMSDVATETFFVGYGEKEGYEAIPVMEISFAPDDLFSEARGIYMLGDVWKNYIDKFATFPDYYYEANFLGKGRGWERRVDLEYFDGSHTLAMRQTAGMRVRGNISRWFNQKGFNLYARKEYGGTDVFAYDFFGDSETYDELMLSLGDSYWTKLRDVFVYPLVEDRAAGGAHTEPCLVFLNGEFWGLYNLEERPTESYVQRQYGLAEDEVFVMKKTSSFWDAEGDAVKAPCYEEWRALEEFVLNSDMSDAEAYAYVRDRMDIDSFIDYCVIEIYAGNYDWWNNNHVVWKSTVLDENRDYADGKWRWILYDLDACAGSASRYPVDSDDFALAEQVNPFLASLLHNAAFTEKFATAFMDIANRNFAYSRVKAVLEPLADLYEAPVVLSEQRFRGDYKRYAYESDYDGNYTEKDFRMNVGIIDDYFRNRYGYITAYMREHLGLKGELAEVNLSVEGGVAGISLNTIDFGEFSGSWSGGYYTDYPITLTCRSTGGKKFTGWSVNGEIVSDAPVLTLALTGGVVDIAAVMGE